MKNADVPYFEVGVKNLAWGRGGWRGTPKISVGEVQQMSWNNYTISEHNMWIFFTLFQAWPKI